MSATLSLNKCEPKFDAGAHYGEVYGIDGVGFVQGKNYFSRVHQYVREAPKEQWLAVLTPEQELDRRQRLQANRKFFGSAKKTAESPIPQAVLDAQRENSKARAAESAAA